MSAKPKVAFYWCASCGGCEETVVDLNADVLKVVDAVDIVLWPVALDFKRKDIEAMADGEIAVSFINGAVRLSEQQEPGPPDRHGGPGDRGPPRAQTPDRGPRPTLCKIPRQS